VESVTWKDCQEFNRKLAEKVGGGCVFRLPTEAQWEYACRAGSTGNFCFGDDPTKMDEYGWSTENAANTSHPVGQKKPNVWGLYDMHGNVGQWCADFMGDYPSGAVTDPTGAQNGLERVFRGGGWGLNANNCSSAHRRSMPPDRRNNSIGFRVEMDVPDGK
jgi:formylglycine-generating enzyme required for sulfatase activity